MFEWLKKIKKKEVTSCRSLSDEDYTGYDVSKEIPMFIEHVHNVLVKYTSVEIMMIGNSFHKGGMCQVWYRFHNPSGQKDVYPIQDYKAKVVSKIERNKYATFKIMYAGFDSDGDYVYFDKDFDGEKAFHALSFFCSEVEKQRKHEQLLKTGTETIQ